MGLFLLEMPVNLSQYRGSVGIFNNRNFFVQSKVSHFTYLSNNNSNNNYNLAIGLLILLNKIALVLLLLNLMFIFRIITHMVDLKELFPDVDLKNL